MEMASNSTDDLLTFLWSEYNIDYYIELICVQLQICVDSQYLKWLIWMTYPVIIVFLLPIVILIFLYASILFLQFYKHRNRLKEAYMHDFWDGARSTLAVLWDGQGKIWHGYEVDGLDKIPSTGSALVIYYHGAIPIDLYYVIAKCILRNGCKWRPVADHFLFKVPGFKLLLDVFGVFPGTVDTCIDLLEKGNIVAISPGGVREAFFSDENYGLQWGRRLGFAKVALKAKVPVIPMFTQNCREGYRSLGIGKRLFRRLYEKTRLPIVPIYGGFPVKMRTIIGDPIPYDPHLTPELLAKKIHRTLEDMIKLNQTLPGSILRALLQRVTGLDIVKSRSDENGDVQNSSNHMKLS